MDDAFDGVDFDGESIAAYEEYVYYLLNERYQDIYSNNANVNVNANILHIYIYMHDKRLRICKRNDIISGLLTTLPPLLWDAAVPCGLP